MVRKKYSKKEILTVISCTLLGISALTFYIWHQTESIRIGYEIGALEKTIQILNEEVKSLETQKAALLSLDRVEKIARQDLELVEPQEGQVIYEDSEPTGGNNKK
jgi:cell division protein FtsL